MTMFDSDARDLAIQQFCQPRGSEADLRGHWSVMRGDPDADRPQRRAEFEQHLTGCGLCREFEKADGRELPAAAREANDVDGDAA